MVPKSCIRLLPFLPPVSGFPAGVRYTGEAAQGAGRSADCIGIAYIQYDFLSL